MIEGNRLDGVGMSGENHADSLIDVKGNAWRVLDNTGTVSGGSAVLDGFQVHDVLDGWGHGTVFRGNLLTFPSGIDWGTGSGCRDRTSWGATTG